MTAYEMRISDWSSDVCSSDLNDIAKKEAALETTEQNIEMVKIELEKVDVSCDNRWACCRRSSLVGHCQAVDERTYNRWNAELASLRDREKRPEERKVGKERVSTGRYEELASK